MNFRQKLQEAYQAGYRSGLQEQDIPDRATPAIGGLYQYGKRPAPSLQKKIDDDLRRIREIQREIQDREDNRNIRRFRDIKRDLRGRRFVGF